MTTRGAITEGKFYLKDGNLGYRSSRTTGRRVSPKTTLTVTPADPKHHTGRVEYERAKE